ncbi:DUF916 domain-containing protein [Enterococcus sp. 669A]|uniref:DUF916 domain-containing protein n=1 Tax=Candidatus Enterococcus moelleringii TaxID=2815325 RepID=A0ABS3L5L1_9ENTE|nr:DUF916 domain-containing protein [Enterococcus sp. 669A]MBO1304898.1 DUF916 domain-containing protein [Enterococcus sp. 669A]
MFKKYAFLICILVFSLLPITAQAQEVGFGAASLLPENQLDNSSYFNLLVDPGKKQQLHIQLKNFEDHPKTIVITPTTAFTNKNGQLDYSISRHVPLSGPNFRDVVSPPQNITLQPKETKIVTFTLSMPKESFSGLLLGGFHIQDEAESSNSSFQQEFSYTIGVMLRAEKALPDPQLHLNQVSAVGDQLAVQLENPTGALISQYRLTGTLKKNNGKSIDVISQTISAAPQDAFTLLLAAESELTSGNYTLQLKIAGEKTYHFQEKISIDKTESGLIIKQQPNPLVYLLAVAVLIALPLFIFQRRRKRHV